MSPRPVSRALAALALAGGIGASRPAAGAPPGAAPATEDATSMEPAAILARAERARQAGDCKAARADYRLFLRRAPGDPRAADARRGLAACGEVLPPPPVVVPPEPTRWHEDRAGQTLVGFGIVVTAGGGFLAWDGHAGVRAYEEADTPAERRSLAPFVDGHRARRTGGIVATAVGAGCLVGGIVRFALVRSKGPAVTVGTAPGGAVLVVGGTF